MTQESDGCSSSSRFVVAKTTLQKKMNKANQFLSEVFGFAHATEYGDDFLLKKRYVESRKKLSDKITTSTRRFLFPGALVSRMKISTAGIIKDSGTNVEQQPETLVGDSLLSGVQDLGAESFNPGELSRVLYDTSIAFKSLAVLKNRLVEDVSNNLIKPQSQLKKDYTSLTALQKKLESRRLEYDSKKRKKAKSNSNVSDEDVRISERKFLDLKAITEEAMTDFIKKDVQRVEQLKGLNRALLHYHRQAAEILQQLHGASMPESASANTTALSKSNTTVVIRSELVAVGTLRPADVESPMSSNNDDVFVEDDHSVAIAGAELAQSSPELPTSPALGNGTLSPSEINNNDCPTMTITDNNNNDDTGGNGNDEQSSSSNHLNQLSSSDQSKPQFCQALDDYTPDESHKSETLSFRKGETIEIINRTDDNWLWGRSLSGHTGYVPTSYVVHVATSPSSAPPLAATPDSNDNIKFNSASTRRSSGNIATAV